MAAEKLAAFLMVCLVLACNSAQKQVEVEPAAAEATPVAAPPPPPPPPVIRELSWSSDLKDTLITSKRYQEFLTSHERVPAIFVQFPLAVEGEAEQFIQQKTMAALLEGEKYTLVPAADQADLVADLSLEKAENGLHFTLTLKLSNRRSGRFLLETKKGIRIMPPFASQTAGLQPAAQPASPAGGAEAPAAADFTPNAGEAQAAGKSQVQAEPQQPEITIEAPIEEAPVEILQP